MPVIEEICDSEESFRPSPPSKRPQINLSDLPSVPSTFRHDPTLSHDDADLNHSDPAGVDLDKWKADAERTLLEVRDLVRNIREKTGGYGQGMSAEEEEDASTVYFAAQFDNGTQAWVNEQSSLYAQGTSPPFTLPPHYSPTSDRDLKVIHPTPHLPPPRPPLHPPSSPLHRAPPSQPQFHRAQTPGTITGAEHRPLLLRTNMERPSWRRLRPKLVRAEYAGVSLSLLPSPLLSAPLILIRSVSGRPIRIPVATPPPPSHGLPRRLPASLPPRRNTDCRCFLGHCAEGVGEEDRGG